MPTAPSEYRRMELVKRTLVKIGSVCGAKTIHFLNSCVNYLAVGHWMKERGFHGVKRYRSKRELFQQIAERVAGKKVLYLEFGVSSGKSMQCFAELLKNPVSYLHGFDTFEGLPEDWVAEDRKGAYSMGGHPPDIQDARVRFFQGLFQETLPNYVPPGDFEALIINIDCDLYSSASFVLKALAHRIQPGTVIYFDEFSDRHNELRAFQEFLSSSGKRFSALGATSSYAQVSFECCG